MTLPTDSGLAAIHAAGRLTVYSLLATGFMFPTTGRMNTIRSTLLPGSSILDLGPDLNERVETLAESVPADVDRLRSHYMELFPPIASQDAPGYETGYRGDGVFQQSAIMADIAGFYRAHGLRAGGEERERLDHITVELEFMAVLAKKEALALEAGDPENASICRDTAATFLAEHLGCWGPAFGLRASMIASDPWYVSLAECLVAWLEEDLDIMEAEPIEIADSPIPQEPADDGSCGPCPTPVMGVRR
jgi:TorA maturation chaperone TorD